MQNEFHTSARQSVVSAPSPAQNAANAQTARPSQNGRAASLAALLKSLPMPQLCELPVAQLTPYPEYGRESKIRWLTYLRSAWAPQAMGVLAVSLREDSTYWVIDGCHRTVIAKELGTPVAAACLLFRDLTEAEEAALYHAWNDSLPQSVEDKFHARLAYGDELALKIDRAANKAGYAIGGHSHRARSIVSRNIKCITAMEGVEADYGIDHLEQTLLLLHDAWGGDSRGVRDYVVSATAGFLMAYQKQLDMERLASVVGELGWSRLIGAAHTEQHERDVSLQEAVVHVLRELYNKGAARAGVRRLSKWNETLLEGKTIGPRTLRRLGAARHREAVWNERINESDARPS